MGSDLRHLRASSLPRVWLCPASAQPAALPVGDDSPEARLGTAVHECWTASVSGNPNEWCYVAERYGVDADEVHRLTATALKMWYGIAAHYPEPKVEYPMAYSDAPNGIQLTGHADVISVGEDVTLLADLKTGHTDSETEHQMKAYAFLALHAHLPTPEKVYVAVLRVRDQTIDGEWYSREQLEDWYADLLGKLKVGNYSAGRHCGFCPKQLECEVNANWLRKAAWFTGAVTADSLAHVPLGPATCGRLYDALGAVEKACETARELLRARTIAGGGTLDLEDGRELAIVEEERRKISFERGWPVLLETAADTKGLLEAVTVSKTKVEAAIRAVAPKRGGAAAIREAMDRLDAAGAIQTNTTEKMVCRKRVPLQIVAPQPTEVTAP